MSTSYYINTTNNRLPANLTTQTLESACALDFHQTLPGYAKTPLITLPGLAKKYGVADIYVKDESKRFGMNAFKSLGAVYAIHRLLQKNPNLDTFCTATDGNHGKAVAWGTKLFGKKSVVYVPSDTTASRMDAIAEHGALVEKINGNYDDACAHAERMCNENGWQLVQDMAWEGYEEIPADIVAGYISMFIEMENSLNTLPQPEVDIVFLQAGVGSFAAAGIFYYLHRYGVHRPAIVIVEPREADAVFTSFQEGKLTTSRGNASTIMAGLNCGTPSSGAWDLLKSGADLILKIDDHYACQAMRDLYHPVTGDDRIIAGESGAAGLAGFIALCSEKELTKAKEHIKLSHRSRILFVNTEGDTDKPMFDKIVKEMTR
ncbi:MAG: diaminopropionate ammonia-lyase [Bacteroidetes bacterium]|nr:MAG: diaminopropionate ammonia-lyase [Bacteroidota bacterium]